MQIPNSYMMQRLPLGKLVGAIVFVWGIIIALTSLGKNFTQLAGLRFLLGLFEACVNPNFMLLTSIFYRKQEVASRLGAWWLVNGLCSSFGGLVRIQFLNAKIMSLFYNLISFNRSDMVLVTWKEFKDCTHGNGL
jgi:MFS family permease